MISWREVDYEPLFSDDLIEVEVSADLLISCIVHRLSQVMSYDIDIRLQLSDEEQDEVEEEDRFVRGKVKEGKDSKHQTPRSGSSLRHSNSMPLLPSIDLNVKE